MWILICFFARGAPLRRKAWGGTNHLPLKRKGGFRRPRYGVFCRLPIGDGRGMGRFGAFNNIGLAQAMRLSALGLAGLLLANCSGGQMAGKIDPRYGVAASARVVEPGQPVPKGGGVYRVGKSYSVAGRVYVPEENTNYLPGYGELVRR
jgi:hypothetical protein